MSLPPAPAIDYTSRDYLSIRDDLLNLIPTFMPEWTSRSENDFGIVLLELFAYVGDQLHYYADRIANEVYLDTATQRDSVIRLARMLGYSPKLMQPATTTLTFTNINLSDTLVPAGTQVATSTNGVNGSPITFETDSDVTVPSSGTITVTATEGETISGEQVGVSDGTGDQTYTLFNKDVLQGSVTIAVSGVATAAYSYVPRLSTSGPFDQVFTTTEDASGVVSIIFGDGANGLIPPLGSVLTATYRIGQGSAGNLDANTLVNVVSPISGVSAANLAATTGGADDETTDSIRDSASKWQNSQQRAVTLQDYANLAVQVANCGKANAASSVYTSVTVYVAPQGGGGYASGVTGSPTAALTSLLASVDTFLQSVCPAPTSVTVLGPTYVPMTVVVQLHLAPQASQAQAISDATTALEELLDFDNVIFGDQVTPNDVYLALSQVNGVLYTDLNSLYRDAGPGVGVVSLATNEIPYASTVTVTATGGTA